MINFWVTYKKTLPQPKPFSSFQISRSESTFGQLKIKNLPYQYPRDEAIRSPRTSNSDPYKLKNEAGTHHRSNPAKNRAATSNCRPEREQASAAPRASTARDRLKNQAGTIYRYDPSMFELRSRSDKTNNPANASHFQAA